MTMMPYGWLPSLQVTGYADFWHPARFLDLALQHGDLMTQDQDLSVFGAVRAGEQREPAEHPQHH